MPTPKPHHASAGAGAGVGAGAIQGPADVGASGGGALGEGVARSMSGCLPRGRKRRARLPPLPIWPRGGLLVGLRRCRGLCAMGLLAHECLEYALHLRPFVVAAGCGDAFGHLVEVHAAVHGAGG